MSETMDVACWIEASVCRADTHVYWSGVSCRRVGSSPKRLPDEPIFHNHVCAIEVFLDLIKRHVIRKVRQQPRDGKPFFHDESWQEIRKTLEAHPPNLVWSSPQEPDDPDERRYLVPDWHLEYELEVDRVTRGHVVFDFSLYGYKYQASSQTLSKEAFYIYADRLRAHVRFRSDWAAVDEALSAARNALRSPSLASIRQQLDQLLDQATSPEIRTYEPMCAEVMRLTEKLLRDVHSQRKWKTRNDPFDRLIQTTVTNLSGSEELEQMLKLISKPYRDYVQHGRPLSHSVARTLLATGLEAISALAALLDERLIPDST